MFWVGRIHTGKANYDHTMYKETYVWTWDFYTTLAGCIVRHLAIGVVLVPHLQVLCLPLLSKYLSRIIHCFYFNLELSAISINYKWNSCSQGLLFSSGLWGLWWRLYGVLTLCSFHICDCCYTSFVEFPPTLVVIPRVGDQFWHVNERWNGKVIF